MTPLYFGNKTGLAHGQPGFKIMFSRLAWLKD